MPRFRSRALTIVTGYLEWRIDQLEIEMQKELDAPHASKARLEILLNPRDPEKDQDYLLSSERLTHAIIRNTQNSKHYYMELLQLAEKGQFRMLRRRLAWLIHQIDDLETKFGEKLIPGLFVMQAEALFLHELMCTHYRYRRLKSRLPEG